MIFYSTLKGLMKWPKYTVLLIIFPLKWSVEKRCKPVSHLSAFHDFTRNDAINIQSALSILILNSFECHPRQLSTFSQDFLMALIGSDCLSLSMSHAQIKFQNHFCVYCIYQCSRENINCNFQFLCLTDNLHLRCQWLKL